METLAYIYTAIAYEDPNPDPEVRGFQDLSRAIVGSATAGTLAVSMATAPFVGAESAQALMRYGDVGPGVSQLQEQLTIRADQVYGRATRDAVEDFQWRRGLQVDGVAGPATLSALGLPSNLSAGGGTTPVSGTTTVAARALNVRSYASLSAPVRDVLYQGERVSLTGASRLADGYTWVQLSQGGWVAEYYLSYGDDNYYPVSGSAYVTAGPGLYIRSAPAGAVIGGLRYGQTVSVMGDRQYADGYAWVRLASGGWVAENYLAYY